jgi:hypothetical protein
VGHLRENGFAVSTVDVSEDDLLAIKSRYGVRRDLESCHTGTVDGYVIEGHVPADDIRRLLQERPEIVGLTVPGMPAGSPGMEVPGGRREPFDVLAFDEQGNTEVYSSH